MIEWHDRSPTKSPELGIEIRLYLECPLFGPSFTLRISQKPSTNNYYTGGGAKMSFTRSSRARRETLNLSVTFNLLGSKAQTDYLAPDPSRFDMSLSE